MIRLNINEQDLENNDKLLEIINSVLFTKSIFAEYGEPKMQENFDYYNGVRPVAEVKDVENYEVKTFNLAKPITDIATKTFIGVLPDITTSGKKSEKDKISVLNSKLYHRSFGTRIYQTSKNMSICGTGFLALYNEKGDDFPRFRDLNPRFADVVYDCSLGQRKLFAFNILKTSEVIGSNAIPRTVYVIYIYTKDKIKVFRSTLVDFTNPNRPIEAQKLNIVPYGLFRTSNGLTNEIYHGFDGVPIVEFPNNQEYKGDFEPVKGLIDLYNDLQNNRCLNVKDIVNYVLMIKNVRVGNEEEQQAFTDMLTKNRVLALEGEDVDARFLSNPLDQSTIETLAKSIKQNIDLISRVPDLSGVDFSQNASDPIIKIKTKPLLDLCCEKELSFTEPYLEVLRLVLEWCKKNDKKNYGTYDFDLDLVSLKYAHPLPSNDLDMVTQIANLSNAGALPLETALQEISWIPNVHDAIKEIDKRNEKIDKRKALQDNKSEQVANETNLERQNSKVLENDFNDNKRNGALAIGNQISDNKVE